MAFTFEVDGPAPDGPGQAVPTDADAPPPMPPRKPPRPKKVAEAPAPAPPAAAPSDIEQPPAPAPAALPLAARSAPVVSAEVHAGPVTKAEESALRALEAKFGGLADKDRFAVVLHCPSSNFHCLSLTCPLPFHCPSMTCPLSYPAGSQCPGGG